MMIRESKIFNSLSKRKEILKTIEPGKIRFYSCGPTVYNLIHIGNLRSALVSDLFFRYWKSLGYKVLYARNYTDVEDKILKKAKEEGIEAASLSERYIKEVEKDYASSGTEDPSFKPKVTEHIQSIIETIEEILNKKMAYVVDGNVIFSVDAFTDYGKLSGKNLDQLIAGARVEIDSAKKNPLDFYLWKAAKKTEELSWESPWGMGRPGWHIECSAMIRSLFGDQIDVHHGGVDLIFPHHENEIAQSEACSSKSPFARYWLHHEFVTINEEKMSKSVGNVFLAREFLEKFGGEIARYMLLVPHYRSPIDFSENSVQTAIKSLERIYEAKDLALALIEEASDTEPDSSFSKKAKEVEEQMQEYFADDLHTPGALASFFDFVREFNKGVHEEEKKMSPGNAKRFLQVLDTQLVRILGIGDRDPKEARMDLSRARRVIQGQEELTTGLTDEEIQKLLDQRKEARAHRDFKRADEIRDQLLALQIEIKDTPDGAKWQRR